MNSNKFIIGDIHGMSDMLNVLLREWNPDSERLIFLGDYIDRGKQSKEVLKTVLNLKEYYDAVLLKGNHEDMLLQWLDNPVELADFYLAQGGYETLRSFGIDTKYNYEKQAFIFYEAYISVIESIRDMQYYHQDKDHIYVHAGINPHVDKIEDMSPIDLLWIRNAFFYKEHRINKKVVFGHTPTRLINSNYLNEVWVSNCGKKIGIDGGAASGGYLIGLRIRGSSYEAVYVNQELEVKNRKLYI